ncbi:MAG: UDP-N-acetylmuramoyl-L-alanine--D-glutamate ligase [Sphingomonadales bacterium]
MIDLGHYSGKTMAVFGLARSGLAAARALLAGGARVLAWDESETARERAGDKGVPLTDLHKIDWKSVDALVLSPGIPLHYPEPHPLVRAARRAGRPVIGDVELFAAALKDGPGPGPMSGLVAVTGTNGKSTTTALIGHVLQACGRKSIVAGNIGHPVLALDPVTKDDIHVLELSSYQIDLTCDLAPDVGVLLNITPDHLDRHGDMNGYVAAKKRLFDGQGPGQMAVVGIDDDHAAAVRHQLLTEGRDLVIPISAKGFVNGGVWVADGILYDGISGAPVPVGDVSAARGLPGRHNWQNAAAAYAVARVMGLQSREIVTALESFPGLAHRLETLAEVAGVRFVNDSKATNADAAARALDAFDSVYWIVGGKPKVGGIESLRGKFNKVRRAYLIGEASDGFAAAMGKDLAHVCCGTLERAVGLAAADARRERGAHNVVLLSPACASFDQFADFEVRGDAFRAEVRALVKNIAEGQVA